MIALSDRSPQGPALSAPLSARLASMPKTPHATHTIDSFVHARFGCKLGPQIGSGGFGEARVLAHDRLTISESHTPRVRGDHIAIKITDAAIDRTGDKPRQRKPSEIETVLSDCAQEMACQAHFSHLKHVVGVFDSAVDGTRVYLAMQLGHSGDLYKVFSDAYMARKMIAEATISSWLGDILEALAGMAQDGFIHRDVKLENFLLDDSGHAMVSDFGYAAKVGSDGRIVSTHFAGTWESTAPEVMRREGGIYSEKSDVFALGVALYELLTVTPSPFSRDWGTRKSPFDEQWACNERMRRAMIEALPKHVSKAAREALYAMLAPNADDRPTFDDLLGGTFFHRLQRAPSQPRQMSIDSQRHHQHHHHSYDEQPVKKHRRADSLKMTDIPEEPRGRQPRAHKDDTAATALNLSAMSISDSGDRSLIASLSPARSARFLVQALSNSPVSLKHVPSRV